MVVTCTACYCFTVASFRRLRSVWSLSSSRLSAHQPLSTVTGSSFVQRCAVPVSFVLKVLHFSSFRFSLALSPGALEGKLSWGARTSRRGEVWGLPPRKNFKIWHLCECNFRHIFNANSIFLTIAIDLYPIHFRECFCLFACMALMQQLMSPSYRPLR